jgi:hypothetical protein
MRGSRYEVLTTGFDSSRQGVGSDPDQSGYNVGLRVPSVATSPTNRYTMALAQARFGGNRKARLVGMRQLVTIGQFVANDAQGSKYPLELQVTAPWWSFTDGNISWHLRRIPIPTYQTANTGNTEGKQFLYSRTPALLFSTAGLADGTGYVPPFGGKIPGVPLVAELGTFRDLRTQWSSDNAWYDLDIEIEGPCDIILFASVKQTDPATRGTLVLPESLPAGTTHLPSEDAFVVNFPQSIYWRVAGSLVFEEEQYVPEPFGSVEPGVLVPTGEQAPRP